MCKMCVAKAAKGATSRSCPAAFAFASRPVPRAAAEVTKVASIASPRSMSTMAAVAHPANKNLIDMMDGNKTWVAADCKAAPSTSSLVQHLVADPFTKTPKKALVISCARSVAPMDSLFGTNPGELQVVRVVGNVCTQSDGVLGSVEYALASDQAPPLVMVMGNSNNAAVTDAVRKAFTESGRASDLPKTRSAWAWFGGDTSEDKSSALVDEILPAARDALLQEPHSSFERLCELAGKLNVWRTVETLLTQSTVVYDGVKSGRVQVHGSYFDVASGKVAMMGEHPSMAHLLEKKPKEELVRDAAAPAVPAEEAYASVVAGNSRYASGHGGMMKTDDEDLLVQLSEGGQNPVSIVLGCADSRAPIELLFDMKPGDLFVLRNAGNTAAAAKGSVIGSAEYSVANLKTKCILVLGHTKCGAVTAAVQTVMGADRTADGKLDVSSLDLEAVPGSIGDVLRDIVDVAAQAVEQLPEATLAEQVTLATELNVHYTMEKVIKFSPIIRDGVVAGDVKLYGGVYDIFSGSVIWLGQHTELERIIGHPMPVHTWKMDPYKRAQKITDFGSSDAAKAITTLVEGNKRFVDNTPKQSTYSLGAAAGASDIAETDPVAVVVGGAEANVPLEKIFDSEPGSLVVQRSMCNIAGRAGGTLFNSLEYAVQKWKPKLLVVMGESHSGIIDDSFKQISGSIPPSAAQNAILSRVMVSALRAQDQVDSNAAVTSAAGRDNMKREIAVELNALYTIEQLLTSPIIKDAVANDGLELHAAMLDATTGQVSFLGQHPMQAALAA